MTSVAIKSPPASRAWALPVGAVPVLGVVASLLCVFAVVVVGTSSSRDQVDRAVLEGLIVGVPVVVGLYAARSPHTARFGVLLVCAGCVWSLTALAETSQSLPYSIGRVSAWLVFPALMYLMLAFPAGRLEGRRDVALYGGVVGLIGLLFVGSAPFVEAFPAQTPWATCSSDCPPNAFLAVGSEPAVMANVVLPLREALAVLLGAGIATSLVLRYRTASVLHRRTMGPLILMSIVFSLLLAAYLIARWLAPGAEAVTTLGKLWSLSVPGVAAAFFVGLVRRRLAIGEVLASLSAGLSGELDAPRMRTALATALRDPKVDLLLPDVLPGCWRGSDGCPTSTAAAAARGQTVTPLLDDGVAIVAVAHDRTLDENAELLEAVAALLSTALRHQRLTDRLATSLEQLDESRKRIASAADVERSRIERDLHDGAQQRLIALRIRLSLAEDMLGGDPAAAGEALRDLGGEIELALEEVRSLAHGLYPSLLNDRGLPDALRSVLSQAPLAGHLRAQGVTRQCREVETAVYFACLEAVQNAIKHAPCATVWVSLEQNHALRFEVRDDGPGFVPPPGEGNGGLRNMRDRVETVGGRLTIDSAPGHGTSIRGVVPLR